MTRLPMSTTRLLQLSLAAVDAYRLMDVSYTNCRFDDPEDPELIDVYPLNYDPQTHRFNRILPRDHTYHIERDTVRL